MVGTVGVSPFSPIDQVTPFTYRDNSTHLQIQRHLEEKLDDIINQINLLGDKTNNDTNNGLAGLRDQIIAIRQELLDLIAGSHDESIATDPTTGNRLAGLSTVVAHVYDNLRIYAYFALQYDNLNLTAAQYDALQYSARQFDLVVTYPTVNAVQA